MVTNGWERAEDCRARIEAQAGGSGAGAVYLIHDAVGGWVDSGWEELAGEGSVAVYVCAYNLEKRRMALPGEFSPVVPCGLSMLSRLWLASRGETMTIGSSPRAAAVEEADRVTRGVREVGEIQVTRVDAGGDGPETGSGIRFD